MRASQRDPDEVLPLSDRTLQVLLALAEGEAHGYGVLKRMHRHADRHARMSVSTLYAVIQRLERDGLIEESDLRPDPALDDERRRYYQLTPWGRAVCGAELRRLERLMRRASRLRPTLGDEQ